jgi:hypothetical protein
MLRTTTILLSACRIHSDWTACRSSLIWHARLPAELVNLVLDHTGEWPINLAEALSFLNEFLRDQERERCVVETGFSHHMLGPAEVLRLATEVQNSP